MIYGVIPIGGKGLRLGLPYSKEMLPQKNYTYYNPVANHLVEKMRFAGAETIVFVHSAESFKHDVSNFFSQPCFIHIVQNEPGFAKVLLDFYENILPHNNDQILFGLPDSIFDGNPFVEMLSVSGVVAGIFSTSTKAAVDRLTVDKSRFVIKSKKTAENLDEFWGVLKFDGADLTKFIKNNDFSRITEIGELLNQYSKNLVFGGRYFDIGEWESYNSYLSDTARTTSTELEKKYDATDVMLEDFITYLSSIPEMNYEFIESPDYYYTGPREEIEFVRYRAKDSRSSRPSDITIKNRTNDSVNRFELEVPLGEDAKEDDVNLLLQMCGLKFHFSVFKQCHIFSDEDKVVVLYTFNWKDQVIKIIEIELIKYDYNILLQTEAELDASVLGFSSDRVLKTSKFRLIKELQNDAT